MRKMKVSTTPPKVVMDRLTSVRLAPNNTVVIITMDDDGAPNDTHLTSADALELLEKLQGILFMTLEDEIEASLDELD